MLIGMIAAAALAQPTLTDEQLQAMSAYARCLIEQTNAIDDGLSDVTVVASAIAPLCSEKMELTAVALGKGLPPPFQEEWQTKIRGEALDRATAIVVSIRGGKQRRATQAP